MNLSRRGLLGGLAALAAAPAIVRVENIMRIAPKLIVPDALVSASYQTGFGLIVNALPFPLKMGDILTIEDVHAINRYTKKPGDQLRQFVVTANASVGDTFLPLYPGIIPAHAKERYATVDKPPMNNAKIKVQAWS